MVSGCGPYCFHAEFALTMRLINARRVDLSPVIIRTLPVAEACRALELAGGQKRAMKVLINSSSPDFAQPP